MTDKWYVCRNPECFDYPSEHRHQDKEYCRDIENEKNNILIIGAGLAGATIASFFPGSIVYEKNKIAGLCADNDNYQDFIHILHTDNKQVWDFVNCYTTVRPHTTILKSYYDGEPHDYPPKELTDEILEKGYAGYSKKMWLRDTPPEAKSRIITSPDGRIFHEKYEGIPDFTRLFKNLLEYSTIVDMDVKKGDLDGQIILTGAIDEYYNYCFGELPYRGMQSVHYESEIGLDGDFYTFSDEKIPFQRLVDYSRLGYKGRWIGVESACNAKHYPIRDEESTKLYEKYKALADEEGIILCGRLATYHYLNMDEVIEQAFEVVRQLWKS